MSRVYFRRIKMLFVIFIFLFAGLTGRLFKLQVVDSEKLTALADKIRTQLVPGEEFPRGDILDRNGKRLLDTSERSAVAIFPSMLQEPGLAVAKLSTILNLPEEKINDRIELSRNFYAKAPLILRTNLSLLEEKKIQDLKIPGIYIVPVKSRYGPNSLAVHLIGHVNSIDPETWEKLKTQGKTKEGLGAYKKSDVIGVKGLEAVYEDYLRVTEPEVYLAATVDAKGKILAGLGFDKINNSAGTKRTNVVLTLDKKIQEIVEAVMDRKVVKGAVVVTRVSSGEILAMASRPEFNQNAVSKYIDNSENSYEFINRALEHYYPGSVFKVVIAAAALEEGIVTPEDRFICSGKYIFDTGLTIPCWKGEGHGELTFTEALAQSCNSTFIEVGLRLGRERILEYAKRFGLSEDILLGYKLHNFPSLVIEKNSPGAIGNASLGQQGVMLSPLQVAGILATVANEGIYMQPKVVERLERSSGEVVKKWNSPEGKRAISKATAVKLQKMLTATTTIGTAKKAWIDGWGAAGKTSTAQTGSVNTLGQEMINAWFAGFAPIEKPEYAVAVMVENGKTGGTDAAPVFKEIMQKILDVQ